jgi:methylated-DNA-protein-cysteine methyltransferase related protein
LTDPARITLILDRIRAIPPGFVRTYGDIDPHAPRLVGRVLATTDAEVPWHRVVRADGTLARGARQQRLLRQEGVPMRGSRVDLAQARLPADSPLRLLQPGE